MAAGAVSLKNLTKCEEVRKLEKELIRLNIILIGIFFYPLLSEKTLCT